MKISKGNRKVWLYTGTVIVVTGIYLFAAPHDTPTFSIYMDKMMAMFGLLAAGLTGEHFGKDTDSKPSSQ